MKHPEKVKNVMITINNWKDKNSAVLALYYLPCTLKIIAFEKGKIYETEHIQAVLFLERRTRFSSLLAYFFHQVHIEPVRDKSASIEYVKKDGNYEIIDGCDAIKEDSYTVLYRQLKAGKTPRQIIDFNPKYIKQISNIKHIYGYFAKTRSFETSIRVAWIYGETCAGKTTLAYNYLRQNYGEENVYMHKGSLSSWFGYDGHTRVLLDDYRCTSKEDFFLLRNLLQPGPYTVHAKYTSSSFLGESIIITSIKHPRDELESISYIDSHGKQHGEDINQVLRRIDRVIRVNKPKDRAKGKLELEGLFKT